ncbi:unnamed protein product [Coregonus sp. 'balchen']|nr:unnamed protein product [Coregonus sp. 'balchen']
MATFFGEVLSVYSRAVEEDDDDLDAENEDEQIHRAIEEKSWDAVGHASLWNERSRGSSRQSIAPLPGEPACLFYRHRDNPAVFGCLQKRGLSVMVLSDSPVAEYKTPDYLYGSAVPFLRSLKSSASKSQALCPALEQPNILTGLPAAVLSHCQVHQIPAVLYQCYTDVISPDSITMETYKPVLLCLSKLVKVFGCLQKRGLSVMVLSDSPVAEYKTPDYLYGSAVPFLRSLKSSASKSQALCPALEQPNILTGLPAAVLSHCQVHQIPAVLYQCYTDVISPDSITMETYKPVLLCLSKLVKLEPCLSADVLRKFAIITEAQSNLYT